MNSLSSVIFFIAVALFLTMLGQGSSCNKGGAINSGAHAEKSDRLTEGY